MQSELPWGGEDVNIAKADSEFTLVCQNPPTDSDHGRGGGYYGGPDHVESAGVVFEGCTDDGPVF